MPKPLSILVLEDDHMQVRDLVDSLQRTFKPEIRTLSSEHEFQSEFESIAANPPDFAILDRMVRWAAASESMPTPPETPWDPEQAGVRCAKRLKTDPRTDQVQTILYSVLGDDGDTEGFDSIVKELEFENVIEWIREQNQTRLSG